MCLQSDPTLPCASYNDVSYDATCCGVVIGGQVAITNPANAQALVYGACSEGGSGAGTCAADAMTVVNSFNP